MNSHYNKQFDNHHNKLRTAPPFFKTVIEAEDYYEKRSIELLNITEGLLKDITYTKNTNILTNNITFRMFRYCESELYYLKQLSFCASYKRFPSIIKQIEYNLMILNKIDNDFLKKCTKNMHLLAKQNSSL